MAVLYNFTHVYVVAFAFNAFASYIQTRWDRHLSLIADEVSTALDTYQLSGDFVATRRQLRASVQRT